MITISLDEFGKFENEGKKPLFIAGLIYEYKKGGKTNPQEEKRERKRIKAYYKRVLKDAGNFKYPNDLHSNGNLERDRNVIKPVKAKVNETLPEFIAKGTYEGLQLCDDNGITIEKRSGRYHIFVMLKSNDGKINLLDSQADELVRDDQAANRYVHMAWAVVNKIIFHNPIYTEKVPAINIELATRATGIINEMDLNTQKEFKNLYYKQIQGAGGNHYSVMNSDIYRTLISQEMVNSGKTNVRIERFGVDSIQYNLCRNMEFLYMSDSICGFLGYGLSGKNADIWLDDILAKVDTLNPNFENLVFGYDQIDNDFTEAWNCYERKEYFKALSITYEAMKKEGRFAKYYIDRWFPYLENIIRKTMTPDEFTRCVEELSIMLNINNLDQEKLLYLMRQFEAIADVVAGKYNSVDLKSRVLYKLYDAGVSSFCHIGDSKNALQYYEKCKKYVFYVGVDSYLITNTKRIVCLEDCFRWDEALEASIENIAYQEMACDLKKEIIGTKDNSNTLEIAKATSQCARIYALKRDMRAEEYFRDALKKFEKGSANYKITQSYLLHFYADMGLKDKFEAEATDYFNGNSSYEDRFDLIMGDKEDDNSAFSVDYAFYVLIRGLFLFDKDNINSDFWKKLTYMNESLEQKNKKRPNAHPWEITFKYMEMIAVHRKNDKIRKKFEKLRIACMTDRGEVITALEMFGEAQIHNYAGEIDMRDDKTLTLAEYMVEKFDILKDKTFSKDGTQRFKELEEYFTFMYR
jgi:hypothetical protein